MANEDGQARSFADWRRAPKDGSLINIEFPGGDVARAWWDLSDNHWKLFRPDGRLGTLRSDSDATPVDWWPTI